MKRDRIVYLSEKYNGPKTIHIKQIGNYKYVITILGLTRRASVCSEVSVYSTLQMLVKYHQKRGVNKKELQLLPLWRFLRSVRSTVWDTSIAIGWLYIFQCCYSRVNLVQYVAQNLMQEYDLSLPLTATSDGPVEHQRHNHNSYLLSSCLVVSLEPLDHAL